LYLFHMRIFTCRGVIYHARQPGAINCAPTNTLFLIFVISAMLVVNADACTTFCIGPLFGKNYDWSIGNGLLIVNPANLEKTSVSQHPAHWRSKFGSITFNQFGREFPSGGMNQAGLVIELMWLDGTKYPSPDARPTVGTLEWIQYQLDTSRNVQDVLQNDGRVRIESDIPLHFLVADAQGGCATIEFLKGKLVSHSGKDLPVSALTNDTYENSLKAWRNKLGASTNSLGRFVQAASMVSNSAETRNIKYAFEILRKVAQPDYTKWSIVYDRSNMRIYFKTAENQKIRFVNFSDFDFSCASQTKIVDLAGDWQGNIASRFVNYTTESNRTLVFTSYRKVPFLSGTPETDLNQLAHHGEAGRCAAALNR